MARLPNAPLQEVIFEVRWALDVSDDRQEYDTGYSLAPGILRKLAEERFPFHQTKYPANVPSQILNYQPVHQYWVNQQEWPLIQLGPGIFAVNETAKTYDWDTFFPIIRQGINWLMTAYEDNLKFNYASLHYIDSVPISNYMPFHGWAEFVNRNFKIEINNHTDFKGTLSQLQINQVFQTETGESIQFSISNSQDPQGRNAMTWQTILLERRDFVTCDELFAWADRVHYTASELFKETAKPKFYDSFTSSTNS